uniref:Transposase Tc1-like domain-containing protein n=1 Tax=Labrus bergylta TaxID=56723 RepID=A0A3Q3E8C8_9LABR
MGPGPSCSIIWSEPLLHLQTEGQVGHPKETTPQVDRILTLSALRNRKQSSTDLRSTSAGRYGQRLSTQTIRNRLHVANLQSHKAASRPAMTALHFQAHLRWDVAGLTDRRVHCSC